MIILENKNYIQVICKHCKSRLGVHREDIRYNEIAHRCPTFEARCKACERFTEVKEVDIPKDWIDTIVPDLEGL